MVNLGRGRHKLGVGGIVSTGALELRAANSSERVAVELDSAGPVPTLAVEDEELPKIGPPEKTCLSELKLLRQRPQKARDMLALQQLQQQQQEHTTTADGTGEESGGRGRPRQAAPQKCPSTKLMSWNACIEVYGSMICPNVVSNATPYRTASPCTLVSSKCSLPVSLPLLPSLPLSHGRGRFEQGS